MFGELVGLDVGHRVVGAVVGASVSCSPNVWQPSSFSSSAAPAQCLLTTARHAVPAGSARHAAAWHGDAGPVPKRTRHSGEALGDAVGATLGAAVTGLDVGHIDGAVDVGAVDVGDELGASVRASPKNRQPSSLVSGKAASQYRSMLRRHADDAASAMQTGS